MQTRIDQISDRIYRISTCIPEIAPGGFTFNQFLVDADEPLLYHTGMRALFPAVREAVERVMPLPRLRWIAFAHLEADECGAVNEFLGYAPHAQVAHGALGCMLSLNDQCLRPPHPMAEGEVLDLGGASLARRVLEIATPHVPHNWESHMFFEQEPCPRPTAGLPTWSRAGSPSCTAPATPATARRCCARWPASTSSNSDAVPRASRPSRCPGTTQPRGPGDDHHNHSGAAPHPAAAAGTGSRVSQTPRRRGIPPLHRAAAGAGTGRLGPADRLPGVGYPWPVMFSAWPNSPPHRWNRHASSARPTPDAILRSAP